MEKRERSSLKHKLKSKVSSRKSEHVVVKKHHSKPYRKRHYGALAIFTVLIIILAEYVVIYRHDLTAATTGAKNFVSDLFAKEPTKATVSSSYGFSVSYDSDKYFAGAVDTATGDLFIGKELATKRPYEQIRFSTSRVGDVANEGSMKIQYFNNLPVVNVKDLVLENQDRAIAQGLSNPKTSTLTKVKSENVTIGGVQFIRTEWTIKASGSKSTLITANIVTYRGVVNSKAMVISEITGSNFESNFTDIINSLTFGDKAVVSLNSVAPRVSKIDASSRFLDSMMFTAVASAAAVQVDQTELTASKYSPAVVKIYNFYCMDIKLDGVEIEKDVCDGWTGSGFFISSDGYIATNGHVGVTNPKFILISRAIHFSFRGQDDLLGKLIDAAEVSESEFNSYQANSKEQIDFLIDKLYGIDDSRITASNNVTNILVGLNDKVPDIKELFSLTEKKAKYTEQDSIKNAETIGYDYRPIDGLIKWRASDAAIIKISGSNYPVAKTGTLASVQQGSALTILGFPGAASSNGIVDENSSKVTVTSGKVSAIKNANGSDKKLVETDTTIGHGNSGGPAFDSTGKVIGLATYGVFATGDGTFNYIRDIKDVLDLATNKSVKLTTTSTTQNKWEEGLDLFYKARYSKAVKKFEQVKASYSQHSKVDEFIASANERIKNGQDVKDFPYILVGGAGAVLTVALVSTLVVVKRHKVKHNALMNHINTTGQNPFVDGGIKSISIQPQEAVAAPAARPDVSAAPQPAQPDMAQAPTPTDNSQTPTSTQPPA